MLGVKNNRDKVIDHFPISSRKLKIGSVTKQPQMVGWLVGLHLFISFEKIAPEFLSFSSFLSVFLNLLVARKGGKVFNPSATGANINSSWVS